MTGHYCPGTNAAVKPAISFAAPRHTSRSVKEAAYSFRRQPQENSGSAPFATAFAAQRTSSAVIA